MEDHSPGVHASAAAQLAPSRRVTRADVARLAGVSTAVVSYVVNDGPRPVAKATATRVRNAMDKLGYLPNASARALRSGRTETLGLVLGDSLNPYFTEYTFELVKAAAKRGKRLLIGDSRQDQSIEAEIVADLVERQVDGLLFASSYSRVETEHALGVRGIPSVLIDCPAAVHGQRTVGSTAQAGTRELVAHLASHGRRRIGIIIGDHGFGNPDPREKGWREALRDAGLPDGPIARVPFTRAGGYAAGLAMLRSDRDMDAIFASNDLQAIGLVRALHESGVKIPSDMAVGSFDGTEEAAFCWPPLTVVKQDLPTLASQALDLLSTPAGSDGIHVEVPTSLITRASCGCDPSIKPERPPVEMLRRHHIF